MSTEPHAARRWLAYRPTVVAVITALGLILASGLILRGIDLNRIEPRQVEKNTQLLERVQDQTEVLCARGQTLINLIDGALILVGQRLVADIEAGRVGAVRADQQFLEKFSTDREDLITELTGEGPCAPR
jgi:hypothetical protein